MFLQHLVTHPVVLVLLAVTFALSMLAFWARVRRENRPDYKAPRKPFEPTPSDKQKES